MIKQIKPERQGAPRYHATGSGDSGWLLCPAYNEPLQVYINSGTAEVFTSGANDTDLDKGTTGHPWPYGPVAGPYSDAIPECPRAIRIVDKGEPGDPPAQWDIMINIRTRFD